MQPVKIYLTRFCPYCHAAKNLLSKEGIPFEEIDLTDTPQELQALKQRTGQRTVPQIFIGEEMIGGFDDLNQLHQSGQLASLLGRDS